MELKEVDISNGKISLPIAVCAWFAVIVVLFSAASWGYEHLAGSKDVESVDMRISRVVSFVKEETSKQIDERKALEVRIQSQFLANQATEIESHRQILNRLDSIDSFLRSGPRHALFQVNEDAR